jgi:hypothetical protein
MGRIDEVSQKHLEQIALVGIRGLIACHHFARFSAFLSGILAI